MIKTKQFRSKSLSCGCCGLYFKTWESYEDQDQDAGYGICQSCQKEAEKRVDSSLDSAWKQIQDGIKNPETKKKFKLMPLLSKRGFAAKMIGEGFFTWKIS